MMFKLWFVCALSVLCGQSQSATLFEEEARFYKTLISLYQPDNVNMVDFTARVNNTPRIVTVEAELLTLQDMDEVSGTLELMLSLNMTWTDTIVTASGYTIRDLFNINNTTHQIESILIPENMIWTPEIVLINAVESLDPVGGSAYKPRYFIKTGDVVWNPIVKVNSVCLADVTFYPFDVQTCVFHFVPWGRKMDEIQFKVTNDTWKTEHSEENGEWTIERTSTQTSVRSDSSCIELSITVKRKPLYFAFNMLLPLSILVALNGMVFWLPVEERIQFSVTCFLSFVVFLNMVMDFLPESSSPMSYLCYYSVCMMIFSGALTGVVILQMRLFHRPDQEKVPDWIQTVMRCVRCRCHRKIDCIVSNHAKNNNNSPVLPNNANYNKHNGNGSMSPEYITHTENSEDEYSRDTEINENSIDLRVDNGAQTADDVDKEVITWLNVTSFLDVFLFLVFVGGQAAFTLLFVGPIGVKAL